MKNNTRLLGVPCWEIMVYIGESSYSFGAFTDVDRADNAFRLAAEEHGFTKREIDMAIKYDDNLFKKVDSNGKKIKWEDEGTLVGVMQWTRDCSDYTENRDTKEGIEVTVKEKEDALH